MTADEFASKLTGSDQCTIHRTGEWAYEVTLNGISHKVVLGDCIRACAGTEFNDLLSEFAYYLAKSMVQCGGLKALAQWTDGKLPKAVSKEFAPLSA